MLGLDLRQYFINAMNRIHVAMGEKHLATSDTDGSDYRSSVFWGKTTHPSFEQLNQTKMLYRLRSGMSASDAIESILTSHSTYVECGVTTSIAYYLAVLQAMQHMHGELLGRKRFDKLFGERNFETPNQRRLILSPFSVVMGTKYLSEIGLLPVQPLSFFIDTVEMSNKVKLSQAVNIGSQLVFAGDPRYVQIHPAGMHGGYNCIVTSTNPLKVVASDAIGEITEDGLYELHISAFADIPTFMSFAMLDPKFRQSEAFLEIRRNGTSKERIPGFLTTVFRINPEKFESLIFQNEELLIPTINDYLELTKMRCIREGSSFEMASPSMGERTTIVTNSNIIESDYLFALNKGLKNFFKPQETTSSVTKKNSPNNITRKDTCENFLGEGLKMHLHALVEEEPTDLQFRKAANDGDLDKLKRLYSDDVLNSQGNRTGQTALHRAAARGHINIVHWLLSKNADVRIPDFKGEIAFNLAMNYPMIQEVLASHPNAKLAEAWSLMHKHILEESRKLTRDFGVPPPDYDPKSDCLRIYKGNKI